MERKFPRDVRCGLTVAHLLLLAFRYNHGGTGEMRVARAQATALLGEQTRSQLGKQKHTVDARPLETLSDVAR